eukprot:CFRG3228T1
MAFSLSSLPCEGSCCCDALLLDLEAPITPPAKHSTSTPVKVAAPSIMSDGLDEEIGKAVNDMDDILAELQAASLSKTKSHDKGKATPTPEITHPVVEMKQGPSNLEAVSCEKQTSLPKCEGCNDEVTGEPMTVLGMDWHDECFKCKTCKQVLGSDEFFAVQGQPYCKDDYEKLTGSKCAYCNKYIDNDVTNALGRTWHKEHFFCSQCGVTFPDGVFFEQDGKAYCQDDYYGMFAPHCGGCSKSVMDACLTAIDRSWHPECFVCYTCKGIFSDGKFFEHETKAYCELHWHAVKGTLCSGCDRPIEGQCVTATGNKKFHPEHFTCHYCRKQLAKSTYKQQGEHYFCLPCNIKLFE